jgi:hypothetical protein
MLMKQEQLGITKKKQRASSKRERLLMAKLQCASDQPNIMKPQ